LAPLYIRYQYQYIKYSVPSYTDWTSQALHLRLSSQNSKVNVSNRQRSKMVLNLKR